jgi:hypothetical protein
MVVKVFDAPVLNDGSWTSWQDAFRFAAADMLAYEYEEKFDDKGSFQLTMPYSASRLACLGMNTVLCVKDDFFGSEDWHIVEDIYYDGRIIRLSGFDSKSLLFLRQTVPPIGSESDRARGALSLCCRRLLQHNCMASDNFEVPANRQLPITDAGTVVSPVVGYLTAYENLGEVIHGLCGQVGAGFQLPGTLGSAGFRWCMVTGTDRSYGQTDRARVAFSLRGKNTLSLSFEHSISNLKNCMYTKDTNGTIQTVHRDSEAAGLRRRECTVSVPVDVTDEMFDTSALKEVEDNVETHSYNLSASAASGYGSRYFLGDIVTVRDDFTGGYYNGMLTAASKGITAGSRTLALTIGKPKQKLLDRIVKNMKNGVI